MGRALSKRVWLVLLSIACLALPGCEYILKPFLYDDSPLGRVDRSDYLVSMCPIGPVSQKFHLPWYSASGR
jgi:hypothetical protein